MKYILLFLFASLIYAGSKNQKVKNVHKASTPTGKHTPRDNVTYARTQVFFIFDGAASSVILRLPSVQTYFNKTLYSVESNNTAVHLVRANYPNLGEWNVMDAIVDEEVEGYCITLNKYLCPVTFTHIGNPDGRNDYTLLTEIEYIKEQYKLLVEKMEKKMKKIFVYIPILNIDDPFFASPEDKDTINLELTKMFELYVGFPEPQMTKLIIPGTTREIKPGFRNLIEITSDGNDSATNATILEISNNISEYQIMVWTAIMLGFTLLGTILTIIYMPFGEDTAGLYSKFHQKTN